MCSSCSTSQHREVDELIAKLEHGSGPRRGLLTQLADKLAAARDGRGKVWLPGGDVRATPRTSCTRRSRRPRDQALLADMVEMRLEDDSFDAKLSVLKEQVSHHAHEEEEKHLFPKVKSMLTADERAALRQRAARDVRGADAGAPVAERAARDRQGSRSCRASAYGREISARRSEACERLTG